MRNVECLQEIRAAVELAHLHVRSSGAMIRSNLAKGPAMDVLGYALDGAVPGGPLRSPHPRS